MLLLSTFGVKCLYRKLSKTYIQVKTLNYFIEGRRVVHNEIIKTINKKDLNRFIYTSAYLKESKKPEKEKEINLNESAKESSPKNKSITLVSKVSNKDEKVNEIHSKESSSRETPTESSDKRLVTKVTFENSDKVKETAQPPKKGDKDPVNPMSEKSGIKQSSLGDLLIKTESIDKRLVTKVTIEKPDKVKETVLLPKKGDKNPANPTPDKSVIKQSSLGDLLVKTETNDKHVVTKVTIEKSDKVKETAHSPKKGDKDPADLTPKPVKKKILIDFSASYTERNFITPMRAMTEYLLKQSDLETLPKVLRRSPYEYEPPITVYYRKDVEAKAIEIWGSKEALEKELLRRELDRRRYEQDVFTVKRRLRTYRRELGSRKAREADGIGLKTRSGRVVLTAVAINGCNFFFKLCAWLYTGSHSLFSECLHSLADTLNQIILAYGIHKSVQEADPDHPYGYTNMRYVSSLISGVGIFCIGCGLSFYHGVTGLLDPQPMHDFFWAYFVLGGALTSEGATLMIAINAIRKGAREQHMPLYEYIMRSKDPSVNVVALEDTAAVTGVVIAGSCMALTQITGSPVFDAIGCLLVGSLLGGVASFIILTNVNALVGRSIPQEQLDEINSVLERDFMIRAIHDVKGIDMGSNLIRYKAEVDFDGRALTRSYLEKHDLVTFLEDIKKIETIDHVEAFLLKHGENIVDMLGGEIDRIELKLRKKFPAIRHCDLEIL